MVMCVQRMLLICVLVWCSRARRFQVQRSVGNSTGTTHDHIAVASSDRLVSTASLEADSIGDIRILIIVGETGSGKSNLANFLAGRDQLFRSSQSMESVTSEVQIEVVPFFGLPNNGLAKLVDCPGLMDTSGQGRDKEQWDLTINALQKVGVEKSHAIILVVNGAKSRLTKEVKKAIQQLRESFGSEFWKLLRVVVTRSNWDVQEQRKQLNESHNFAVMLEEKVEGKVSVLARKHIEAVKVYSVDMAPWLLDADARNEEFLTRDCEDLLECSFGQLVNVDVRLQAMYREHGVESFGMLKRKFNANGDQSAEFKSMLAVANIEGAAAYKWGQNFGSYNLGRLDELRQDVLHMNDAIKLNLRPLKVKTKKVSIIVESETGTRLAEASFDMFLGVTLKQIHKAVIDPLELVKDLKQLGWLKTVLLHIRDGFALITDSQLQMHVQAIMQAPDEAVPDDLFATVEWTHDSPPALIEGALVDVCVQEGDIRAADALVKDGFTETDALVRIDLSYADELVANTDLQMRMPHTLRHESVFQGVKNLRSKRRLLYVGRLCSKSTTYKDDIVCTAVNIQNVDDTWKKLFNEFEEARLIQTKKERQRLAELERQRQEEYENDKKRQCEGLASCHESNGQGKCVWHDESRSMTCNCLGVYFGQFCHEKPPPPSRRRRTRRRRDDGCFPADAKVRVKGDVFRELQHVSAGDFVAVADPHRREVYYERLLGDFHSDFSHNRTMEYLKIFHEKGTSIISANHYIGTVERGFTPAGDVHVGDTLLVQTDSGHTLSVSQVLRISRTSKKGMYAPFTFRGTLLVDGVLASSYTADEFRAYLSPWAQRELLARVGGHDGVNWLIHVIVWPLRMVYRLRLPELLKRTEIMSIPNMASLMQLFSVDCQSTSLAESSGDLPLYVNIVGRTVGFVVESLLR